MSCRQKVAWDWKKVSLVMSCCRARRVYALRRGWVSIDPWAPDTDLHRCRIRRVECVVDCRRNVTSGRDEKDVDVRSCSCGVAEKKSAARNGSRAPRSGTHAITGTLLCMEWRARRLRWCKNGTIVSRNCPATIEWYGAAHRMSSAALPYSRLAVTFEPCMQTHHSPMTEPRATHRHD